MNFDKMLNLKDEKQQYSYLQRRIHKVHHFIFAFRSQQFAPLIQCPPFVVIGYFTQIKGLVIGWKMKYFLLLDKFAINQIWERMKPGGGATAELVAWIRYNEDVTKDKTIYRRTRNALNRLTEYFSV